MLAIKKEPGREPEIVVLENTLEALQEAVGGKIEAVALATDVALICNEEGRLMGLEKNGDVFGRDFVGTILMVGVQGEDFGCLPPNTIRLLMDELKEDKT